MKIKLTLIVDDFKSEWGVEEAIKLYGKDDALNVLKNEIEGDFWRFYEEAKVEVEILNDHSPGGVEQSNNSKSSEHGSSVLPVQG